jgi:hypothetical protein
VGVGGVGSVGVGGGGGGYTLHAPVTKLYRVDASVAKFKSTSPSTFGQPPVFSESDTHPSCEAHPLLLNPIAPMSSVGKSVDSNSTPQAQWRVAFTVFKAVIVSDLPVPAMDGQMAPLDRQ